MMVFESKLLECISLNQTQDKCAKERHMRLTMLGFLINSNSKAFQNNAHEMKGDNLLEYGFIYFRYL